MAKRVLPLRKPDRCAVCTAELAVGDKAWWDSEAKTVTCLSCASQSDTSAPAAPPRLSDRASETAVASPTPIDTGTAGASARREFDRRRQKSEAEIEAKWGTGRLGRIAKRLSDDPQTTKAWGQGATGEERVAEVLHERLGGKAVVLHDRRVPKTRGNIDHIAIALSGIWIIDAKRYRGKVEKRDVGGFFRSDVRLYVGGRDQSKAVADLGWQVEAVRHALGDESVPVHSALSFVGAEWPLLFPKPFQVSGVWISWAAKLADLVLGAEEHLSLDDVERMARLLAEKLPIK